MKIKKGDMVQVISGKDKGAQGKVIEAYPKPVSYTHLTLPTICSV